jgi:hypothetical protein
MVNDRISMLGAEVTKVVEHSATSGWRPLS